LIQRERERERERENVCLRIALQQAVVCNSKPVSLFEVTIASAASFSFLTERDIVCLCVCVTKFCLFETNLFSVHETRDKENVYRPLLFEVMTMTRWLLCLYCEIEVNSWRRSVCVL
jgi:hypothetical protein